jgi:hypothetical protein
MTNGSKTGHEDRQRILRLLSDDDIARASMAEATAAPLEGEEFLDLEDLGPGVRVAEGVTPAMRHLLLRRSVHPNTWTKILEQLRCP